MHLGQDSRRGFLRDTALLSAGVFGLAALTDVFAAPEEKMADGEKEEEISPVEDLMREHGVLNRILLIYEECAHRLEAGEELAAEALTDSAAIIRSFIEDYHEKLEENHVFPRFEKAGKLADLTRVLREQHNAGRKLTDAIRQSATAAKLKEESGRKQLIHSIRQFVRMYRPHEAREDTVLFPALRAIASASEYRSLGEAFEEKEHELFGEAGFGGVVERTAAIEKKLAIHDLARFTPRP